MNNTNKGRNDLLAWGKNKPSNFFTSDKNLQYILQRYMENEYAPAVDNLSKLGADAATTIDSAAKIEDRLGNHPRLERWSGLGERIEQIEFHPNHYKTGQLIWRSGIMAMQADKGRNVEQMGLYYLLCHNGESGHLCSLACTSGLIRAIQEAGSEELQNKFLPPLLNLNYDEVHQGAQFLTEVQGGSDVGANAVIATVKDDGTYHINGEKWFCSNINADQFLMTARATSADGTRGLGLFLVPRTLDDGTTNGFYIRRLKDKLGTRTLASAELDFRDAVAYPIGAVEEGFKTVVELVLNTSRLMNAVACAGIMRRVFIEAGQYACHRQAFGQAIANFPMVQETIVDIMSAYYAGTASSFYLAHLLDKIETGQAGSQDKTCYRMLVNINKYITSINGTETIHQGIEILGGNGAIESFSILPRLYRDMIVLESWEGTHNVLCVQVMRDIEKYAVHEAFIADMTTQLDTINDTRLSQSAEIVRDALTRMVMMLDKMRAKGHHYTQAHARRFVDLAAHIAQATLLLSEAQWELNNNLPTFKADITEYFINKHLKVGYDPLDDEFYTHRLERLMGAL